MLCIVSSLSMLNNSFCVTFWDDMRVSEFSSDICSWELFSTRWNHHVFLPKEPIIRRWLWEVRGSLLKVVCEFVAQVEVGNGPHTNENTNARWSMNVRESGLTPWAGGLSVHPRMTNSSSFYVFAHRHARVKSKLDTRTHLRTHKETHTDGAHGGSTGIWRND